MGKFVDAMRSKFAANPEPTLEDFKEGTIAWMIQRYVDDSLKPGSRAIGRSQIYCMRALQRSWLGKKDATKIKANDYLDYCKERYASKVHPATINHDLSHLRVVLNYAIEILEMDDISITPWKRAKKQAIMQNICGKSTPRKRRPSSDEIERLLAHFAKSERSKIPMVEIMLTALVSTRRLGEIVRITHGDIDWDRKDEEGNPAPMYCVRDLKHPTKKKGNDKWFPLVPELAEIIRRQPRVNPANPNERVFPYKSTSCTQRYIDAKKALGITNLRFHDNRREAITRWLALFSPNKVRTYFSGHETSLILERVYDAQDPSGAHAELAKLKPQASA